MLDTLLSALCSGLFIFGGVRADDLLLLLGVLQLSAGLLGGKPPMLLATLVRLIVTVLLPPS